VKLIELKVIGDVPIITDTTSNERKPKELELGEPYKSKYDKDMQQDCAFDNKDPELEALAPMSRDTSVHPAQLDRDQIIRLSIAHVRIKAYIMITMIPVHIF